MTRCSDGPLVRRPVGWGGVGWGWVGLIIFSDQCASGITGCQPISYLVMFSLNYHVTNLPILIPIRHQHNKSLDTRGTMALWHYGQKDLGWGLIPVELYPDISFLLGHMQKHNPLSHEPDTRITYIFCKWVMQSHNTIMKTWTLIIWWKASLLHWPRALWTHWTGQFENVRVILHHRHLYQSTATIILCFTLNLLNIWKSRHNVISGRISWQIDYILIKWSIINTNSIVLLLQSAPDKCVKVWINILIVVTFYQFQ